MSEATEKFINDVRKKDKKAIKDSLKNVLRERIKARVNAILDEKS